MLSTKLILLLLLPMTWASNTISSLHPRIINVPKIIKVRGGGSSVTAKTVTAIFLFNNVGTMVAPRLFAGFFGMKDPSAIVTHLVRLHGNHVGALTIMGYGLLFQKTSPMTSIGYAFSMWTLMDVFVLISGQAKQNGIREDTLTMTLNAACALAAFTNDKHELATKLIAIVACWSAFSKIAPGILNPQNLGQRLGLTQKVTSQGEVYSFLRIGAHDILAAYLTIVALLNGVAPLESFGYGIVGLLFMMINETFVFKDVAAAGLDLPSHYAMVVLFAFTLYTIFGK